MKLRGVDGIQGSADPVERDESPLGGALIRLGGRAEGHEEGEVKPTAHHRRARFCGVC